MKSQKGSITIFLLVAILLVSAGAAGYFLGSNKDQSTNKISERDIEIAPKDPEGLGNYQIIENEFWQEFANGETFSFKYPVDNDTSVSIINGKDSGWPISPLELTFITGVTVVGSNYDEVKVGYSDIDPTVCLNSICHQGGLESISRIEIATISGILSKKVEGTAHGGGGVLPPGGVVPPITLYIIPYKNNFFIISGSPESFLNHIKDSFKVSGN